MQTYSHLLINALVDRSLKHRNVSIHSWAILIGGVIPDLPFFLLTLFGEIYYRVFVPTPTGESPMVYMHFTLFFTDPLWIGAHNFLHAPIILFALGVTGYVALRHDMQWGGWLLWLALGAGVHTVLEVLTHADDGPLLLFPLNWQWRFNSPISYWDPAHYGWIFAPIEHIADLAILGFFLQQWRKKRQHHRLCDIQERDPNT